MHPSKDIVGTRGRELEGKRIVLCITGSVAAYLCPEVARELMRCGADVHAVMTGSAQKIIHPYLMEWATGNPVVTRLTGKIEHIAFTTGSMKADLILVAPCTANTISKIACGIDDTPVTSYVSSALGAGIPIVIAPAMHETMLEQQLVLANVEKLEGLGVKFVTPKAEEGKAKLADIEDIIEAVISALTPKDMRGMKVLVTAGPTIERIDPVRIITNRSSGKMGVSIAKMASRRGAEVTLIYGLGIARPPRGIKVIGVETTEEMYSAAMGELNSGAYDLMVAAAAAADYRPSVTRDGKIPSAEVSSLTLELRATQKIINHVKKVSPKTFLVAFKAEHGVSDEELVSAALGRSRSSGADLVVANDVARTGVGFGADENEVFIVDREGLVDHIPKTSKDEVARRILDLAMERMDKISFQPGFRGESG